MDTEICIGYTEAYEACAAYYYALGQDIKARFDHFFEPDNFFAPKSLTVGIPLILGESKANGRRKVVMTTYIFSQLMEFLRQSIPEIEPPKLTSLQPEEYIVVEKFNPMDSKMLSKYQGKAKQKNKQIEKQIEKLMMAKEERKLASKLVNGSKYVFISFDIEAYEREHTILLEIGWSMYDSKTHRFLDQHYINSDYRHLKNGQFVEDRKEDFDFGVSVWCTMKRALEEFRKDLDWAVKRDGGFVLVGHGLDSDIKFLKQQRFEWPTKDGQSTLEVEEAAAISILNTETIYGASINNMINPPSLGTTLSIFDIDTWNLHNAGNDAHYTLLLLLRLVVGDGEGAEDDAGCSSN